MHFIGLLSLLILGIACGPKERISQKEEMTYIETSISMTPIIPSLDLKESKCENADLPLERSTRVFRSSQMEETVLDIFSLKKWTKKNQLASSILLLGSYQEKIKLTNRFLYQMNTIKSSVPFKICSGAELNSAQEEAYSSIDILKKIEDITKPYHLKLKPLKIRFFPLIKSQTEQYISENQISRKSGFLTDNAYYYGHRSEIVFLPQSQEAVDNHVFAGVPLWKIPMVMAHEYGHHVFRSKVTKPLKTDLCFDNMSKDQENIKQNFALRYVTQDTVLSAINEGFADLFSFYTLKEEASVEGLPCFGKDRGIKERYFSSGTAKIFNQKVLSAFKSKMAMNIRMHCEIHTNFQDIHMVGAVWAHFVDSLLTKANFSNEQKLNFILNWVKKIKINKNMSVDQTIVYSFKSIIQHLKKFSPMSNFCPEAQKLAPIVFKNQNCAIK
jgi:hypothetical protein